MSVATVETWDIDPEYPVREERQVRGLRSRGPMYQARVTQQSHGIDSSKPIRRVWTLQWSNATPTEWARYQTIWNATNGGALAISFTPPGGSAVPVRLVGPMASAFISASAYSFTVMLEEVLNA